MAQPLVLLLAAVLVAGGLTFSTSASSTATSAEPARPTDPLQPRPRPGPFSMNLYESGDFVHQQTAYWCVAASVQTMINIIEPGQADRSRRTQRQLHFQGRRLDQDDDAYWRRLMGEARWRQGLHGLGLTDWAELLNANGYGPYEVDRAETRKQAIRKAARAVRLTGRPAGLVVWRGAHAWVMSGFEATADPAFTNDFKVRKVFIQDPWYPSVSSIWGVSRPPNSAVPVKALDEDYLRYDRPRRKHPKRDGRYMLILPTLPTVEDLSTADEPPPAVDLVPAADELRPSADELPPPADELAPAPDELRPPADELAPAADEPLPTVEEADALEAGRDPGSFRASHPTRNERTKKGRRRAASFVFPVTAD